MSASPRILANFDDGQYVEPDSDPTPRISRPVPAPGGRTRRLPVPPRTVRGTALPDGVQRTSWSEVSPWLMENTPPASLASPDDSTNTMLL